MILQDLDEGKSTDSDGSGKVQSLFIFLPMIGSCCILIFSIYEQGLKKKRDRNPKEQNTTMMRNLCVGFGNLSATMEEIRPGSEPIKLPEAAEMFVKAASSCCSKMFGQCCCMCCVQCCSKLNEQCMIALTQLCTALACFGCFECCSEVCCCCGQE